MRSSSALKPATADDLRLVASLSTSSIPVPGWMMPTFRKREPRSMPMTAPCALASSSATHEASMLAVRKVVDFFVSWHNTW